MTRIAVPPPSVRRLGIAVASVLGPLAVFIVLRQPASDAAFGPPSDAVGVALVLVATLPLVVVDVRPRAAVVVSSVGVSGAMLTGHATNLEALARSCARPTAPTSNPTEDWTTSTSSWPPFALPTCRSPCAARATDHPSPRWCNPRPTGSCRSR